MRYQARYDGWVRKVIVIPSPPQACWRAFTNPETLRAWIPNLSKATVLSKHPDGMPSEIRFELSTGRTYSLSYGYAGTDIAKIVRWAPLKDQGDAVRGFARFEPCEAGTQITYELEQGESRSERERLLAGADEVLDAFAHWMADRETTV